MFLLTQLFACVLSKKIDYRNIDVIYDLSERVTDTTGSITLYEFLGVSSGATTKEIHEAFKKKSVQLHPDSKNGSEKAYSLVTEVYYILKTPKKRNTYDFLLFSASPFLKKRLQFKRMVTRRFNVFQVLLFVIIFVFLADLSIRYVEFFLRKIKNWYYTRMETRMGKKRFEHYAKAKRIKWVTPVRPKISEMLFAKPYIYMRGVFSKKKVTASD